MGQIQSEEQLTEDARVFGKDAWVHCGSHGRPHTTGWCTVSPANKTLLTAKAHAPAMDECRRRGLWLYEDKLARSS